MATDRTSRASQRVLGTAIVLAALAVAVLLVGPTAWRWVDGYGNLWGLPDRITICGRYYERGGSSSLEDLRAEGIEPLIVNPGPFGFTLCVPGACTLQPDGPACDTVIFVRVEQDRYVGYSLEGGP